MIARLLVFLIVSFFTQSVFSQSIAFYGSPEWTISNRYDDSDFNYSITAYYKKTLRADKKKNEARYRFLIGLGFSNLSYQSAQDSSDFICPTKDERWHIKSMDAQIYALQIPLGFDIELVSLPKLIVTSRVELALTQIFWQYKKIDYCLCEPTDTSYTAFHLAPRYEETKDGILNFVPYTVIRISLGIHLPVSKVVALELMPSLVYNAKEWYKLRGNFGVGVNCGLVFKLG